ncbi:nitrate- and nitrite sensing domain-containing protein [Melissospora conviva]|uniref:sensor histidine kinase n=1 Tax=Melissospora conviva TaxID=3388432 RepID=UPI003F7D2D71
MGIRGASLRTKIVALLVSLVALWAFAAYVTLRDGLNLLGITTLDTNVAAPSEPVLAELQAERRLTAAYLGKPRADTAAELAEQRSRTDAVVESFRETSQHWQVRFAGSDELNERVDRTITELDSLAGIRGNVDGLSMDRSEAMREYNDVVDQLFTIYGAMGSLDDERITKDSRTLTQLNRSLELLSRQDALVSGVLSAGRITAAEYGELSRLVGAQRFLAAEAVVELSDADRAEYDAIVAGSNFTRLAAVQDRLQQADSARPPVGPAEWRSAMGATEDLRDWTLGKGDDLVDQAMPVAVGVVLRMVLAAGLGLLAVIASIIVSITTARSLMRQLEKLRDAAHQLAEERLPSVVERLGRGEEVDVAAEAPPLRFGDDAIGEVGQAFNAVQETAVRTAVEQAELRRSVRDTFLSLARRTQALVHRQLTLLDAMERREHDAEELEDLFRVDHLATRMRRNAENLIVLSGSTPGRAWRRNVPMVDVVRGAVAEVEDYTRVNVHPMGAATLAGRAVGDVIHLIAELVENGLSFSPPHTTVDVRGQLVANGFALEIEDRGLGMSEEDLARANERIQDQSELNLANATRLGLYVVSRLSERHGIRVQLKESPYGGTTAVVLIPAGLVSDGDPGAEPTRSGAPTGTGAARTPGEQPAASPAEPATAATIAAGPTTAVAERNGRPAIETDLPVRRPSPVPPGGTAPQADGGAGLPARPPRVRDESALDGPTHAVGLPTITPKPAEEGPMKASSEPGDETPVPQTQSGLPVRVRQANLVPQLRDGGDADDSADEVEEAPRPPEKVRRMMDSYQSGTRRGRTDAARLLGSGGDGDGEQAGEPDTAEEPGARPE